MKKNDVRMLMIIAISLVVFSIISFVLPAEKNIIFWLSYIFAVIAILSQPLFWRGTINGENVKSRFYGFPIVKIGIAYLIAQLPTSVSFILYSRIAPVWGVVVPSLIVMGTVFIGLIAAEAVKEEIEQQDDRVVRITNNMSSVRAKMMVLSQKASSMSVYKEVQQLEEKIRYSDPVSGVETEPMEQCILEMIEELGQLIIDKKEEKVKEKCEMILMKLEERNLICKTSKAR